MPLIDEFLMNTLRVAVVMKEQLIADMFEMSIARVSRVTITWANYLFTMLCSSLNWQLIVVEEFEHLNDPRSYVVRGLMPLVGSPKANRS